MLQHIINRNLKNLKDLDSTTTHDNNLEFANITD